MAEGCGTQEGEGGEGGKEGGEGGGEAGEGGREGGAREAEGREAEAEVAREGPRKELACRRQREGAREGQIGRAHV